MIKIKYFIALKIREPKITPSQQRLLQGTLRLVILNVLGQRTNQQRDVAGEETFKTFKSLIRLRLRGSF